MDQVLIEAVKAGDHLAAEKTLSSGVDINAGDEQGWTPLNFAAGKGDLAMVKFLVERGADPFKTGRDNRTPYMIALAAGRVDVVKYLAEVEDKVDPERAKALRPERKYCKAYHLKDLRQYPHWVEGRINWTEKKDSKSVAGSEQGEFTDEKVIFIHQDFTVTESVWHNENVIFNDVNDLWREYCTNTLAFKVPTDLDLIVPNSEASAVGGAEPVNQYVS